MIIIILLIINIIIVIIIIIIMLDLHLFYQIVNASVFHQDTSLSTEFTASRGLFPLYSLN